MRRIVGALVGLILALFVPVAHAQTSGSPSCQVLLVGGYAKLSDTEKALLNTVLEDDFARAISSSTSPLGKLYAELAAGGYLVPTESTMPAPIVAFAWKNRAACAGFTPASVPPAPPLSGPNVRVETNLGAFTITLDKAGAPLTVENFLRYVRNGHFHGAAVFRIEPDYLIQLGDLDAKLVYRKPKFPPIPLETANNRHRRGAVAMAHGEDPNSGQSSWYVDLADNAGLNAEEGAPPNTTGFAVFGLVTEGMDTIDKIAAVERAPTGGPFPGKLPKVPVVVMRTTIVP